MLGCAVVDGRIWLSAGAHRLAQAHVDKASATTCPIARSTAEAMLSTSVADGSFGLAQGVVSKGKVRQICYCKLRLCCNSVVCHVVLSEICYFEATPYETTPYASPEKLSQLPRKGHAWARLFDRQGNIPLRTSQVKHILKLLARKDKVPVGLSTRLAGAKPPARFTAPRETEVRAKGTFARAVF